MSSELCNESMDLYKRTNAARRTTCPALTPAIIPKFCIPSRFSPIFTGRKRVRPGHKKTTCSLSRWSVPEDIKITEQPRQSCSLSNNTTPQDSQLVDDAKMLGPRHFVGNIHIDSHFESDLGDSADDMKYEIWSESDPGMKLSMTYDHIPKVKTPYGFSFLQYSPVCIKKETVLLSTKFRNRMRHLSSSMDNLDDSCPNKKEECSSKPFTDASRVRMTSKCTVSSNESLTEGRCKTDIHVSESSAGRSNSIQVSASVTYQSSARKCSTVMSASLIGPTTSTSAIIQRVSRTPKMSIDIDRLDAINKLHMLCVGQLFEASNRDLGEIELALQYDRRCRRLRVHVLQANGVGLTSRSRSRNINTYVRLCLMPDKQNPQHTRVVKGTCDPTYNEEFSFNVSPCELISSGLKVRVFQSAGFFLDTWSASSVGEVWLNLAPLKDTSEEIFIREDLKPKANKEDTSMLNVSICYRSRVRKLCITVIRAQKLSKTGFFRTAPDCQIKVEVTQVKNNALSTVVKRTGVQRHTRNPVFKESMSFEIHDLNNLRDGMTVVCTLSSKSLIGKPQTLGQLRFGLGSSRTTEKQQWANVLRNPGHSITQWHTL